MVSKIVSGVLLSVFAVTPTLAQQEQPKQDAKPVPVAVQPATSVQFTLPITGLLPDNAAKTKSALSALTFKECACPECGKIEPCGGECEGCAVALESRTRPVFKELMLSAEKGTASFHLAPASSIRLTTLEHTLKANSVEVQREKIQFAGTTTFVFTGGTSSDQAGLFQKALRDAKFKDAEAAFVAKDKEIHVRMRSGTPTWAQLAELGSKSTSPLKLSDVIWGGMRPISG